MKQTITEICNCIVKPWNVVKQEVVVKSFNKCGMDGTEDNAMYEDSDSYEKVIYMNPVVMKNFLFLYVSNIVFYILGSRIWGILYKAVSYTLKNAVFRFKHYCRQRNRDNVEV